MPQAWLLLISSFPQTFLFPKSFSVQQPAAPFFQLFKRSIWGSSLIPPFLPCTPLFQHILLTIKIHIESNHASSTWPLLVLPGILQLPSNHFPASDLAHHIFFNMKIRSCHSSVKIPTMVLYFIVKASKRPTRLYWIHPIFPYSASLTPIQLCWFPCSSTNMDRQPPLSQDLVSATLPTWKAHSTGLVPFHLFQIFAQMSLTFSIKFPPILYLKLQITHSLILQSLWLYFSLHHFSLPHTKKYAFLFYFLSQSRI